MTIAELTPRSRGKPAASALPPLCNGDHLGREEFHRRYEAMGEGVRAELIEGIVYLWSHRDMPSPVSIDSHGQPLAAVTTWAGVYVSKTPGLILGNDSSTFLDADNEPQPDVLLGIPTAAGGQTRLVRRKNKQYVGSAPELVAEVSASTVSIDLNAKLRAYQRNGVREYLVWRTEQAALDWFALRNGRFEPLDADPADGLLKSAAFPGLWLDPAALLGGDLGRLLAALDCGCATPEHAAFAARVAPPA